MPKRTLFNLQTHDNMIRMRGEVVEWSRARLCSCGSRLPELQQVRDEGKLSVATFRSDPVCPICKGLGVWWEDPIKIKAVGVDVNSGNMKDLMVAGLAVTGDMVLIGAPLGMRQYQFNNGDRIMLKHRGGQPYDGEVLTRGIAGAVLGLADETSYALAMVDAVTWRDDSADPPALRRAVKGEDYEYTVGVDRIFWLEGGENVPPQGVRFSVACHVYYEWIAFTAPFKRVESNNLLGPRVLLRKKHLVGLV